MFASWAVRVPAIKEQTAASSAALGLALLGLSAGAVATMLLAGALCRWFGSPRVTVLSCAVLSLTLPLPALARSALALGLLLAAFGAAYGCLNVAMNSVAVDIVTALRRPVMPGFHAAWSFGGLAGAGLGGLLAPHLSPLRHLLLVALAGLLVSALAGRVLLTRLQRPARRRRRRYRARCRPGRPCAPARSDVARDAANRAHRRAVRPDRVVRRVRRGCDRRLGRAAPAAGPRRGRGRGRRGLRRLRAGRGERAAVWDHAARAARPHQGADPGRPDRLRGHAPGQPRP